MIYFCHGAPGSPKDADLVQEAIIAPNLFEQTPNSVLEEFDASTQGKPVHLIGFSMGSCAVAKIAAARASQVERVTLVSAAAPLQLGDFLREAAGGPVFLLAQKWPFLFHVLTLVQGLMVRAAPSFLAKQMFAKSGKIESSYATSPVVLAALKNAFVTNRKGYLEWVKYFVTDWSDDLAELKCPVTIWHGDCDSWAPPAMANALDQALGHKATVNWVEGGEHYSTLAAVSKSGISKC